MCIMKRLKWDGMHFLMKMHLHKKGGRGVTASEGPSKLDVDNLGPSIMDVGYVKNKEKLGSFHKLRLHLGVGRWSEKHVIYYIKSAN